MSNTPRIPVNQQNAFPLLTIAAANPGDITVVGPTISRFWSGASLGIGASTPELGNFSYYSNPLDVRGCWRFALVLTYTTAAGASWPAMATFNLFFLYGNSSGQFQTLTTPGLSFALRSDLTNGVPALPVSSQQIIATTWTDGGVQPANQAGAGLATVGTAFKLCVQVNANTPAGGSVVGELWGSS